ncbi:methyltransferase domain-containing protein [Campylobacter sp. 19-13652]|uniref:methyltransferase domain-containing protein n=1 Tax=Campylobacter sp. 19-13652 TaxID=2840180 RepID=UPI001C774D1F|nr:methyltransferase domain-containing protein [Campylobacter sp. 19-13652]BCX79849.1 malonyl-[acyl-carrier protein] O-methyltransferase BioC [Campylobacter sp. 19-13652]
MQNVADKFLRARASYEKSALVQAMMRDELVREIVGAGNSFKRVFEFGAGQDELGRILRPKIRYKSYLASDINPFCVNENGVKFINLDMNKPLPNDLGKFDLIVSNACLQWLDARTVLANLKKHLVPNGLLAVSTFGSKNLWQVRELTGLGLDYPSIDALENACKNLKNVKIYKKSIELNFDSAFELFLHLKQSGVNSLGKLYLGKNLLAQCESKFKNTLTYEPVFIIARA